LIGAISQKGLQHTSSRIRFVQVGASAGATISLPAEALRSSGLELIGSGFGSVSIELILRSVSEFLAEAAIKPFRFNVKAVPLRDVEASWNNEERVVFQP
jgi:NADPH2:quinone reductase